MKLEIVTADRQELCSGCGEIHGFDCPQDLLRKQAASAMGKLGGKISAMRLTPEQRKARAKKAAIARWGIPEETTTE